MTMDDVAQRGALSAHSPLPHWRQLSKLSSLLLHDNAPTTAPLQKVQLSSSSHFPLSLVFRSCVFYLCLNPEQKPLPHRELEKAF